VEIIGIHKPAPCMGSIPQVDDLLRKSKPSLNMLKPPMQNATKAQFNIITFHLVVFFGRIWGYIARSIIFPRKPMASYL
jgi:hypothetical protein